MEPEKIAKVCHQAKPGLTPKRLLAAVLSSPGHYDPLGIDTVELNTESILVPQLIIVGGADKVSGTARPYQYFRKYYDRGAPWAFVLQKRIGALLHC